MGMLAVLETQEGLHQPPSLQQQQACVVEDWDGGRG